MSRPILALLLFICVNPILAADIWVTDLTDDLNFSDGTCTLREAINSINGSPDRDACEMATSNNFIYFANSGLITLASSLPTIASSLVLRGPGPDLLTIDGNNLAYGLDIALNGQLKIVELSGFRVRNAQIGIRVAYSLLNSVSISDCAVVDNGKGIHSTSGTLLLNRCTISSNDSMNNGGGIQADEGLSMTDCTVYMNSALNGGGISVSGRGTIRRSTISGNTAIENGGGIYSPDRDPMSISHSTIINNKASGFDSDGHGGGIYFQGSGGLDPDYLSLTNNLIADNLDLSIGNGWHPDIYIDSHLYFNPTSKHSIIGILETSIAQAPFNFGIPNLSPNYVGSIVQPFNVNMEALADNGGPTPTHQFSAANSPGVDYGNCPGEAQDQRGQAGSASPILRPKNSNLITLFDDCDIGAVEFGANESFASRLTLQVFLDGPYEDLFMRRDLTPFSILPELQPYGDVPWNYFGKEEDILDVSKQPVDWVLVDFLSGAPQDIGGLSLVLRRAYLINTEGGIYVPDVFAYPISLDPGNYFISVHHRNHLSVTSAIPLRFQWGVNTNYNFTNSLESTFSAGGIAMRLRTNTFTMWAGDGDKNGSVSAFDFLNVWLPANGGPASYSQADFNMDGSATAFDFLNAWLTANGQAEQVPGVK